MIQKRVQGQQEMNLIFSFWEIDTNVYKNGTGNRKMRHMLWFDPTEDYHTYSILCNNHSIV
ncbi:unnamed protein product [Trifolium pratense]|uniref:Uncharacterized protein n=1 Tax=Trifolium pratense TaxID=57577 RepID=A0ACB0M2X3_TRIPR|nr:unnamed protein product [Trifolium pratense]